MSNGGTPEHPNNVPLGRWLRENRGRILECWEAAARALPKSRYLDRGALLDHLPDLLTELSKQADLAASGQASEPSARLPAQHAITRLDEGFNLAELTQEYALLRRCILELLAQEAHGGHDELIALHHAVDRSVVHSVECFVRARERTIAGLDRIVEAALESDDLEAFLPRLLGVLLQTAEAVDTAAILLRDGDVLRVRAALGLGDEARDGFTVQIGDGFAGRVALEARPLALSDAAADPRVRSPYIRALGVRALYGVPLVRGNEVIGVAHIGSRTATEFSHEDQLLFRSMAARASALLAQAQLHQANRRSEERFRALTLSTSQIVWTTDANGNITEDSPSWRAFTGQSLEQWRSTSWLEAVHPEDRDRLSAQWEAALRERTPYMIEYRLRRHDGVYRDFVARAVPITERDGSVREWVGTNTDVTESRRAERELRSSEALARRMAVRTTRLQNLTASLAGALDAAEIGRIVLEQGLAALEAADGALVREGPDGALEPLRSQGPLGGEPHPPLTEREPLLREVLHTRRALLFPRREVLRARLPELARALEGEPDRAMAVVPITIRDRALGVMWLGFPGPQDFLPADLDLMNAIAGQCALALERVRLLQAKREAAARAEQREAEYRMLIETTPHLVWTARPDGTLEYVNPRMLAYFGRTEAEVVNRSGESLVHPDDRPETDRRWKRAISTGDDYEIEQRLRRHDGVYRWFLSRAVPLRDAQGTIVRWFGSDTEIDDQKRYREKVEQALAVQERVMAILGHDLRNPLSAILMGATGLLRRNELPTRFARVVSRIQNAAERMNRMLDELLDFTRARVGSGIPLQPRPTSLCAVTRAVVEEFEVSAPGRVQLSCPAHDVTGEWDADRLAQVVSNLVGNALRHGSADAPVEVTLDAEGPAAVLTVRNQGQPIPESERGLIFDPFKKARVGSTEGLGLGLYIVQQVVHAHRGSIEVSSSAETGTAFSVRLPLEGGAEQAEMVGRAIDGR